MTQREKVEKAILKDPSLTNSEIALKTGATKGSVNTHRTNLRKKGKLPKLDPEWRRKQPVVKEKALTAETLTPVQELKPKIRALYKKKDTYTIEHLSDFFNTGIGNVRTAIDELIKEGVNIKINNGHAVLSNIIAKGESTTLNLKKMSTGFHRFGAIGDNHLCSRYAREDVLNAIYDEYERQGIKVVYNTGNWIDGEARFNKHDLSVHGMDNQIDYFLEKYPRRKGITTYFIAGDDHEGWYTQREGVDIGKYMAMKAKAAGRDDIVYLGYMEADIVIPSKNGQTVIRVLHPGGGSSYAISYTIQKIVESYQGGEKPHILLAGHYHKADYVYCRGVHCVQTGTTQDQSPFMRKKKLAAHLGGWIIEFATDDNGAVTRFKQEFLPFYDNDYYIKWAYKWK
jgi:hypothetical protein